MPVSQITAFDPPHYFQDRMAQGAFASFVHDHHFEEVDGRTTMTEVIEFRSPLGPLGWLVDTLFLRGYLERLISRRAEELRRAVEQPLRL
jgi:ligand-binding SRPBCC domain-containing protein